MLIREEKISELELQLKEKEALVVDVKQQKSEFEDLKEGMQALSQELDRLTSEKAEVLKQANCTLQVKRENERIKSEGGQATMEALGFQRT